MAFRTGVLSESETEDVFQDIPATFARAVAFAAQGADITCRIDAACDFAHRGFVDVYMVGRRIALLGSVGIFPGFDQLICFHYLKLDENCKEGIDEIATFTGKVAFATYRANGACGICTTDDFAHSEFVHIYVAGWGIALLLGVGIFPGFDQLFCFHSK